MRLSLKRIRKSSFAILIILISIFLTGCKSTPKIKENKEKEEIIVVSDKIENKNNKNESESVDKLLEVGKSKIGSSYKYGSMGPNSFDCSGFVVYSYKEAFGVKLPRTSKALSKTGKNVRKVNLKEGDLVFFKTMGKRHINHVGIYVGGGQFIHSSSSKSRRGVVISDLTEGYYKKAYAAARRVI